MGRARIEWRDGSPMEVTWIVFSVDELVITGVNVGAGCRRLTRAHCVVTRCHVDYVVTGAEGTARMLSAWSGKLQRSRSGSGSNGIPILVGVRRYAVVTRGIHYGHLAGHCQQCRASGHASRGSVLRTGRGSSERYYVRTQRTFGVLNSGRYKFGQWFSPSSTNVRHVEL